MSTEIKVKSVKGGYIVTNNSEEIHTSLESVFEYLLAVYEGRASTFTGDAYGTVCIYRKKVEEGNEVWKKYRVKGASIREVEAIQFDPKSTCWPDCIISWKNGNYQPRDGSWGYVETTEGKTHIQSNDWIVKDRAGEISVVSVFEPEVFNRTYELID